MNVPAQIATHLRQIFSGGNWTSVNLKDSLADVTWQEAIARVSSLNTITALVYHMGYYVSAITKVLEGGPLDAKDKYSFDHPPVSSEEDWRLLVEKTFTDAEKLAALIEQFPHSRLAEDFAGEKYGTWYRNLHGLIEHTHYHLGQVVVIKKLLREKNHKQLEG